MDPENAIDLGREAIRTCIFVGGPILLVCLLIGLAMSVFQAMTQLHDQTISFVPKILLLIVAIGLCLPWLTDRMSEFAKASFEKPMFAMQSPDIDPAFDEEVETPKRPADRVAWVSNREPSGSSRSPFSLTGNSVSSSDVGEASVVDPKQEPTGKEEFLPPRPKTVSPFVLPHYRYEVKPRSDTEG